MTVPSRGAIRTRVLQTTTPFQDSPPSNKAEGGGAPKGACRPLSAPHNQMSPSDSARARKRAKPGRARLPALRRGTRQTGRSRLTQLQNHVSWNGAEAGVLPASRLSSPAGSPQTGPSAGRVVSRSRPSAGLAIPPAGTASRSTLQACLPERRPSIERDETVCNRNRDAYQEKCHRVGDEPERHSDTPPYWPRKERKNVQTCPEKSGGQS